MTVGVRPGGFGAAFAFGNDTYVTASAQRYKTGAAVCQDLKIATEICADRTWTVHCFLLTGEVCAFREEQQLQRLSDVAEVVQHILHVLLVLRPTALNEDKAGHLHSPTWTMRDKSQRGDFCVQSS